MASPRSLNVTEKAGSALSNDSLDFAQIPSLFKLQNAPVTPTTLANGELNICRYIRTPRLGPFAYDCEEGYFCPSPSTKAPCPGGFYCPKNTAQPQYCCPGYYCPTASSILPCPEGYFCPAATTVPLTCGGFASCPEGTAEINRFGVIFVFIGFLVIVAFAFALQSRFKRLKRLKYDKKMERIQFQMNQQAAMAQVGQAISALPTMARKGTLSRRSTNQRFDISFRDLGLTLGSGVEIVRGVSGNLYSGRTCAIMGPSGSGKTTVVNLLMGKLKRTSGKIFVNGVESEMTRFSRLIGLVPQEDVMLRELTVLDILMHSAKMRLPFDWPYVRKRSKVLEIIDFLGLTSVMNCVIGDEQNRGISGGQRKRVNIGMELVAEATMLFLDEPTSGLDSTTSFEVCSMLKEIAVEHQLTVAAVIHSPSPATFACFDDLLLLGKGGRVVYHGPRTEALKYFHSYGFSITNRSLCNPADFFLEVVAGKVPSKIFKNFKPSDLFRFWDYYTRHQNLEDEMASGDQTQKDPTRGSSRTHSTLRSEADIPDPSRYSPTVIATSPPFSAASALEESRGKDYQPEKYQESKKERCGPSSQAWPSETLNDYSFSVLTGTPRSEADVDADGGMGLGLSQGNYADYCAMKKAMALRRKTIVKPSRRELPFQQQVGLAFEGMLHETKDYISDIGDELVTFWSTSLLAPCFPKRQVRATESERLRPSPRYIYSFAYLFKRACLQLYRSPTQFICDQFLHLLCGAMIGIASMNLDYLGKQPEEICSITPGALQPGCNTALDSLQSVGSFVALGVLFAGISVGTNTFGLERAVYWRDRASGMPATPYFFGKVIADIPKVLVAGAMFTMSLAIFWPYRSNFWYIYLVVTLLYMTSFAQGYFLSTVAQKEHVGLIGNGLALCWSLVFGGMVPTLEESQRFGVFSHLWTVSAPRWAIEALYIREVGARPFDETKREDLPHSYFKSNMWPSLVWTLLIGLGWLSMTWLGLKLAYRSRQK